MEERGTEPGGRRAGRGGPWGGRARVGGTPRGGAAEAQREEIAAGSGSGGAAPASRGEWGRPGEEARKVPATPPNDDGFRGSWSRPRARGIAGGAATTKVTCGLGADWRLGAGGADLGHRDSSPETKGQGRPPAPNQVHLGHVAGMDAGEGTASLQLPGPLLGVSERWLRLRGCKTLTLASPWRLEVAS